MITRQISIKTSNDAGFLGKNLTIYFLLHGGSWINVLNKHYHISLNFKSLIPQVNAFIVLFLQNSFWFSMSYNFPLL